MRIIEACRVYNCAQHSISHSYPRPVLSSECQLIIATLLNILILIFNPHLELLDTGKLAKHRKMFTSNHSLQGI